VVNLYLATTQSGFYVANLREVSHLKLTGSLNLNRFTSNLLRPGQIKGSSVASKPHTTTISARMD